MFEQPQIHLVPPNIQLENHCMIMVQTRCRMLAFLRKSYRNFSRFGFLFRYQVSDAHFSPEALSFLELFFYVLGLVYIYINLLYLLFQVKVSVVSSIVVAILNHAVIN